MKGEHLICKLSPKGLSIRDGGTAPIQIKRTDVAAALSHISGMRLGVELAFQILEGDGHRWYQALELPILKRRLPPEVRALEDSEDRAGEYDKALKTAKLAERQKIERDKRRTRKALYVSAHIAAVDLANEHVWDFPARSYILDNLAQVCADEFLDPEMTQCHSCKGTGIHVKKDRHVVGRCRSCQGVAFDRASNTEIGDGRRKLSDRFYASKLGIDHKTYKAKWAQRKASFMSILERSYRDTLDYLTEQFLPDDYEPPPVPDSKVVYYSHRQAITNTTTITVHSATRRPKW